jgi:hypothetical protein
MGNRKDGRPDRIDRQIDEALRVEPIGAALTGRILENVRARARRTSFFLRIPRPLLAAMGSAIATSIVGLGYFAGTLDFALFDIGGTSDLSILLFEDAQSLLEIL